MDRPRLIYYNDAHHFHAKRLDPPVSRQKLYQPVDELVGTGVDLLVLGLGYGDVYFHQSKVGRVVGQYQDIWNEFIDWRIMRMVKDAAAMGTDQVREVIGRGRQLGLTVFPSLKLQDCANDEPVWIDRYGLLKMNHGKSVCINELDDTLSMTDWCYDFRLDIVREEKLAMVREILEDYEADGIELDFMFFPLYFRKDEAEKSITLMNEFVAEIRRMANSIGKKQDREVSIMARVRYRRDDNLRIGLDAETWLRDGNIDFVAAQASSSLMDTGVLDGRWLAEAANDAGAAAYFQLRAPRIEDERASHPNIEMYRAFGQTLRWQGFAGMYLGYLPWPFAEDEYQVLREMAFPDVVARSNKRYFLPPSEEMPPNAATDGRQMPLDLQEGKKASIKIVVADDLESAKRDGEMREPILTISYGFYCIEDEVETNFNGEALSLENAEIHEPRRGAYWFRYTLPIGLLRQGENTLEIEIKKATETAGFARSVSKVEIQTRYKDFERPLGLEVKRVAPAS